MVKEVNQKSWTLDSWTDGTHRTYPQSTLGMYPSGHYETGPFPFVSTSQTALQIHPRPDTERNAYSIYSVAFYDGTHSMEYRRPICVRGGSAPYVFQLMSGPPGMTIPAPNWVSGWTFADALAAGYGDVVWTPSSSGTWQVWVRVFDQEYQNDTSSYIDIKWTVTTVAGYDATNKYGYIFLDPVNGTDPGTYPTSGTVNTVAAPIKTMNWAFGPTHGGGTTTYPGAILVLRGGTTPIFAQDSFYGISLRATYGPIGIMGMPGDSTAYIDLTTAGVNRGFDIAGGSNGSGPGDDFYLGNLSFINGPSALSVTTQPAGTLTDGTYTNVALTAITGAGTGATATVVVSSGQITSITELAGGTGSGFASGDTVSIPSAAITGATGNGVATVKSVVNGKIGTNFSQVKSINFFNRGLFHNVSAPNAFNGTCPNDNCGLLALDDPNQTNVPRQYLWMKGCSITNLYQPAGFNNVFGVFDWYKLQYAGAELCSVTTSPSTSGGMSAYFQKAAVSDTTIRYCSAIGNFEPGSTGDQWNGWLPQNREICYNIFDTSGTNYGPQINLQYAGGSPPLGGLGATSLGAAANTTASSLAIGTYYYVVTAVLYDGQETMASNEVSITTTSADPSVHLTWNGCDSVTYYRIYRGTAAGAENVYYQVSTGTLSFTDTGTAATSGTPPTISTGAPGFGATYIYRCSLRQPIDVNMISNPTTAGPLNVSNCAIEWGTTYTGPMYINRSVAGTLPTNLTNTTLGAQASTGVFTNPGTGDYSLVDSSLAGKVGAILQ